MKSRIGAFLGALILATSFAACGSGDEDYIKSVNQAQEKAGNEVLDATRDGAK